MTLNYLADGYAKTMIYMNIVVRESLIRLSTQESAVTLNHHVCATARHSGLVSYTSLLKILDDPVEALFSEKSAKSCFDGLSLTAHLPIPYNVCHARKNSTNFTTLRTLMAARLR